MDTCFNQERTLGGIWDNGWIGISICHFVVSDSQMRILCRLGDFDNSPLRVLCLSSTADSQSGPRGLFQ